WYRYFGFLHASRPDAPTHEPTESHPSLKDVDQVGLEAISLRRVQFQGVIEVHKSESIQNHPRGICKSVGLHNAHPPSRERPRNGSKEKRPVRGDDGELVEASRGSQVNLDSLLAKPPSQLKVQRNLLRRMGSQVSPREPLEETIDFFSRCRRRQQGQNLLRRRNGGGNRLHSLLIQAAGQVIRGGGVESPQQFGLPR